MKLASLVVVSSLLALTLVATGCSSAEEQPANDDTNAEAVPAAVPAVSEEEATPQGTGPGEHCLGANTWAVRCAPSSTATVAARNCCHGHNTQRDSACGSSRPYSVICT